MPLLWLIAAPACVGAAAGVLLHILPSINPSSVTRRSLGRGLEFFAPAVIIAVPTLIFVTLIGRGLFAETTRESFAWIPALDVQIALMLDGLGMMFALIISGIGALVMVYAVGYFHDLRVYLRFACYTLFFMAGMLGIVLSDNVLLLFAFWEVTSLTSYLLIGFHHDRASAREGARRALLITGGGGLALMAGLILLGVIGGTFDLSALLANGEVIRASPLYTPMLILILLGAFTKSAQFPFHFWLPGAMDAPTPASAYLHSATLVKAGIFLLARLTPVLGDTVLWQTALCGVGLFTFVYGGWFALRQADLKGILAYTTISWLGVLVALIGLGTQAALTAAMIGVLAHALYKGALFLTAGSVDHAAGTRDIRLLGGLARVMPVSFIGAIMAAVSMAGIPPLMGFLAKELLKGAAVYTPNDTLRLIFAAAAVIGSALTVAAALRVLWDTFIRKPDAPLDHPHEVTPLMWIAPLTLGAFTLVLPFLIPQILNPLVNSALVSITGAADVSLHLFEGVNPALILSMIAIALGVVIFSQRRPIFTYLQTGREFNPDGAYQAVFVRGLPDGAAWLTDRLQDGRVRNYIAVVFAAFFGFMLALIVSTGVFPLNEEALIALTAGFEWQTAIICALLIVGAVALVIAPSRLAAIAVLGIEGALVSLLFALFGAPDLAFMQLMIEVVSLVLFILAFHFLPDTFRTRPTRLRLYRDIAVSVGVGAVMTLMTVAAKSHPIAPSIAPYYVENSLTIGLGRNIVNVILVDFRGMDTQGEILVLVIAAMGVIALLRLRPSDQPRGHLITEAEERAAVVNAEMEIEMREAQAHEDDR